MAIWDATRHFCLYPNSVTTIPDSATVGAVWLDIDPIYGSYDPFFEFNIRGRTVETQAGPVIQVFPYQEGATALSKYRRKIQVADASFPLTRSTVNSLAAMYHSLGTKYRFYDGENVFRVWFSQNPPGFKYRKALPPWREWATIQVSSPTLANSLTDSYLFYSYEIVLDVFGISVTPEGLA